MTAPDLAGYIDLILLRAPAQKEWAGVDSSH
jgi:hypothetical protein